METERLRDHASDHAQNQLQTRLDLRTILQVGTSGSSGVSQKDPMPEFRADFIRRLFAVAVSVGFATHIKTLSWIARLPILPTREDAEQSLLLIIAMITVIESWEGYLRAIQDHPLKDKTRFIIDVVIVFEYLVLLTLSDNLADFTKWIIVIFITYTVWDYATINKFPENYKIQGLVTAFKPFVLGWQNRDRIYMGPSITLCWTVYFVLFRFISQSDGAWSFWLCSAALAYGLIVYRIDKSGYNNHGYSAITRIAFSVLPLIVVAVATRWCWLPNRNSPT
jgi:hypothetical protein